MKFRRIIESFNQPGVGKLIYHVFWCALCDVSYWGFFLFTELFDQVCISYSQMQLNEPN